ncbi:MAG: zinc-dependent metalloprotease family protein [Phycisphaerae bacterium]
MKTNALFTCSTCCIALIATLGVMAANPVLAESLEKLNARVTYFERVALNAPADLRGRFAIDVPIDGALEKIELERVSVWAPGAVIKVYDATGNFETIAPPVANTYRGTIPAYPGSWVTGGFVNDRFSATIRIPDRSTLELTPIDGTNDHALIDSIDRVVEPISCDEPIGGRPAPALAVDPRPERITPMDVQLRGPGGEELGVTASAVELAVEADFEYYLTLGASTLNTLYQMAVVVNNINSAYESDANLTHVLTTAIIHTTSLDPYSSTDGATINAEQVTEWTTNQSDLPYDVVMLFTGKDTCSPSSGCSLAGRANEIGSVCDRTQAFCFTEFNSSLVTHAQIAGHELGHLWNARHCDSDMSSSCFGVTPCKLMCSTINACDNNDTVEFAPCNAGVVDAYRQSQTCFTPGPAALVWVDWRTCNLPSCIEIGAFVAPYNTVAEGVQFSPDFGFIMIMTGLSSSSPNELFPLSINKPLELRSFNGSATIGG